VLYTQLFDNSVFSQHVVAQVLQQSIVLLSFANGQM